VNIEQMVKICNSIFMYAMFTFKCLQMAVMIQLFFIGTKKKKKCFYTKIEHLAYIYMKHYVLVLVSL
jgi:hypothetical protein